jgi:2-C-methyl-D-erythritol 2,4-cyclodiphosphate synthase
LRSVREPLLNRVGIGYDIHAFRTGRKLVLGGVVIPSKAGLDGHSDADVVLHAICDALLGAAALGDIGKHFPDSNARYKGVSSLLLLKRVGRMIFKAGYRIVNIDATILLERPKIATYSASMTQNIAACLRIDAQQVSIKATTNEGLGSLGRGEGCAAMAIASITSLKLQ